MTNCGFFSLTFLGLEEQGLYRVVGVSSKVNKLLAMGLDRRKLHKLNLDERFEWESKTITSALKTYLRTLSEPLMTYRLYNNFIAAASKYLSLLVLLLLFFFISLNTYLFFYRTRNQRVTDQRDTHSRLPPSQDQFQHAHSSYQSSLQVRKHSNSF